MSLALTLLIGAAAALAAKVTGVPAPYLTGPALAVAIASLAGLRTDIPRPLRDACFTVIGVGVGSAVTPEAMRTVTLWPGSFLALALSLIAIILGGVALLRATFGYGRDTAILASLPGHLSYVLALSERLRGPDLAAMAVVQSLRVLMLTLLVPVILLATTDARLDRAPDLGPDMGPVALALVLAATAAAGWAASRRRLPAAFILSGMVIGAAAQLSGAVRGDVPLVLAIPAFTLMGIVIGSRFSGVTPALLGRAAGAGVVITVFSFTLAAAFAAAVAATFGLSPVQTLIAFCPGALETMAALAILTGADTAYVAAHHAMRMVFLTFALPLMLARA